MATFICFTSIPKTPLFSKHLQRTSPSSPPLSLYTKAMISSTTSTLDRQSYWSSINKDVAMELQRVVPLQEPLVVYEPMRHSIFSTTKSMAPALCIAACELVGGQRNQAMPTACALHIMHAGFVAHEDMPALLDRPAPSTHATFAVNLALMSSDALFPSGYEWVAKSIDGIDDEVVAGRVLRVILEITRAMGSERLVDGQYKLVQLAQAADVSRPSDCFEQVLEKRDGGFYACAAACGAILGGGSEDEIESLRKFGRLVGMIYGVMDGAGKERKWDSNPTGPWISSDGLGVDSFKSLALMELKRFQEGKTAPISSLVDYFGSGN